MLLNNLRISVSPKHIETKVESHTPKTISNWMQSVASLNPNIRLRDMIIPGTHDSGTYSISNWDPLKIEAQT